MMEIRHEKNNYRAIVAESDNQEGLSENRIVVVADAGFYMWSNTEEMRNDLEPWGDDLDSMILAIHLDTEKIDFVGGFSEDYAEKVSRMVYEMLLRQ